MGKKPNPFKAIAAPGKISISQQIINANHPGLFEFELSFILFFQGYHPLPSL